jgi:uncharacterized membrane protein YgcG
LEFGRKWGIGRKGKNNGVVILASKNPRKINISPGYGLEGALPDAICKRIEVQKMVPNFRTGNYYQGFASAVESIRGTIKGEFVNDQPPTNSGSNLGFTIFLILLPIADVIRNSDKKIDYFPTVVSFGLAVADQEVVGEVAAAEVALATVVSVDLVVAILAAEVRAAIGKPITLN